MGNRLYAVRVRYNGGGILQKRRDPAAFDNRLMFEEVLAFRKPEGQGQGIDTVITSPPYEGSLHEGQAGPGATTDAGAWAEGKRSY